MSEHRRRGLPVTGAARYFKAIVAALIAGLGALLTALADERLTAAEWIVAAIAFLTALGAVWGVPNRVE